MMSEIMKPFLLTDENDIRIRTQYIRSAANIYANKLNKDTATSDGQLAPNVLRHLDATYHKHTIDKFASKKNK